MAENERLICASDDLIDGGRGVRFEIVRYGAKEPAFVVRFRSKPSAFINRCGHVPVEIDWQHGAFFEQSGLYLVCSTHGALYAPESGRCVGGKCNGRGLVPLSVSEHDGQIFLIEEGQDSGGK